MADIYFSTETGQTVTAQLYNDSATVGTPFAMTEITGLGEYYAYLPTTPAGKYLIVFFNGAVKLASGQLSWDGTKEIAGVSVDDVATAVWDKILETGFSASRILRVVASASAGKTTGGPSGFVARNLSDSIVQINGTADSSGNRTTATYGA